MIAVTRLAIGCYALLALTSAHHLYGAARFDTPWRGHVAYIAALVGLALAACLLARQFVASLRVPAGWLFLALAVLLPIGWIGLFEGGYNHLVKDVLFAFVGSGSLWRQMFPAPTYEPPVDFWFEASGILQFFVALWALHAARQVYRSLQAHRPT